MCYYDIVKFSQAANPPGCAGVLTGALLHMTAKAVNIGVTMKTKVVITALLLTICCVLIACDNNSYDFAKEGEELRLRKIIAVSGDWDDDNIDSWHKCDVYYYKAVFGLLYRQKTEDTGYIVYNTDEQKYYFVHKLYDDCDTANDSCIDLNSANIIKVVLKANTPKPKLQ